MVRMITPYIEDYSVSIAILPIYGGLFDLTTFLTTTSPVPHHFGKILTTFPYGGEGMVKQDKPRYMGSVLFIGIFYPHIGVGKYYLTTSPLL